MYARHHRQKEYKKSQKKHTRVQKRAKINKADHKTSKNNQKDNNKNKKCPEGDAEKYSTEAYSRTNKSQPAVISGQDFFSKS